MGRVPAVIAAILVSVIPAVARASDPPGPPPSAESLGDAAEQPGVTVETPAAETPSPRQAAAAPVPLKAAAPPATTVTPAPNVATQVGVSRRPPRRETHGLAASAGFGIAYGLVGVQARYDLPIRPWLIMSPFVSAGVAFGVLSGPFGLSTALGYRHRLAMDLGVAPIEHSQFWLHGTLVNSTLLYGALVAVGYEHMSDGGWFQRATIEYAYEAWGSAVPIAYPQIVFSGLAVGRRIW